MRLFLCALLLASPALAGGEHANPPQNACYYDGKAFTKNAQIVRDGAKNVCDGPDWREAKDTKCAYAGELYSQGAIVSPSAGTNTMCDTGNWVDTACRNYDVPREPLALIVQPNIDRWSVCLVTPSDADPADPGAVRVTVRSTTTPPNGPHLFSDVLVGSVSKGDADATYSCMTVSVGPKDVLAAVNSASKTDPLEVRVCPTSH